MNDQDSIIISGANGYIATMFITRLLFSTNKNIIALVRSLKAEEQCYARIEHELHHQGLSLRDIMPNRIKVLIVNTQSVTLVEDLRQQIGGKKIKYFFHAAGCKDCFDMRLLTEGNVNYTEYMLSLAEKINVDHFYYLSTPYSVGLRNQEIEEKFYNEPVKPVSNYALTMRQAEKLVQNASLSTTIIRISNVIGDSQTGRYEGKNYGLYACWHDLADFIVNNKNQQLHIISTDHKLNFVYQDELIDALQKILLTDFRDEIIHIVSNYEFSPSVEQLWRSWLSSVCCFKYVYTHQGMATLPFEDATHFQQDALRRVHLFLEVAANEWHFSGNKLREVVKYDLKPVTIEGVKKCQAYTFKNHPQLKANTDVTECSSSDVKFLQAVVH